MGDNLLDLVTSHKFPMKDLELIENDNPNETPVLKSDLRRFNIVQLKDDGWWTLVRITSGLAEVISSGSEIKTSFATKAPDALLVCEWIHGTNWAQKCPYKEKFRIFDIVELEGRNLREHPQYIRRDAAKRFLTLSGETRPETSTFILTPQWSIDEWPLLWMDFVMRNGYEGLVFKNREDEFWRGMSQGRLKKIATNDYIVTGFNEGNGRLSGTLGSIEGSLFVNGTLQKICTVGGGFDDGLRQHIWDHKELYSGKVFEARGKVLFSSGSLRHPAFTKWREDKRPEDCVWAVDTSG